MSTIKQPQLPLGGSAGSSSPLGISRISLGLMSLTWADSPTKYTPESQAFDLIHRAITEGGVTLLDAGQFYAPNTDASANLRLIRRFFEKHPEDKDKVLLCVKGGFDITGPGGYAEKGFMGMKAQTEVETLRKTLKEIRADLNSDNGGKDIDLWEPARFPPNVDVAEMVKKYISLRDEGLFKHLALSEVSGKTIEAAVKASNGDVAAVEIEYSPFCLEAEEQGVLKACEEHKIPILAYSPVGKGFLTGTLKSRADIPAGDIRLHQDRFSEENFQHNLDLADKFKTIAEKKGVTASQLALAWILTRSPMLTAIPGTRQPERGIENAKAAQVKLTEGEKKEIDEVLKTITSGLKGGRYSEAARAHQNLWA